MFKLLTKLKGNKKGSMAIEIIIGSLLFLVVLCFLTDITIMTWKFNVISQTNSYLARTVGIQGGSLNSTPNNFPGGDSAYATSSEITNTIYNNFSKAGIKSGEYRIFINGYSIGNNIQVDYRQPISTEIQLDYRWDLTNNFIPGAIANTISSRRAVVSEFKYRYDSWIGE